MEVSGPQQVRADQAHANEQSGFEIEGGGATSALQLAANGSPQVRQLKALQAGVNKSPQVQAAAQLQAATNGGHANAPIQMTKNHLISNVKKYPEKFKTLSGKPINFGKFREVEIGKIVADQLNVDDDTRELILKKYNQKKKRGRVKSEKTGIGKPKDLIKTGTVKLEGDKKVRYEDSESEEMKKASYFKTLSNQSKFITLGAQSVDDKQIPVFDGINAAMKMVRLYWKAYNRSEKGGSFLGAQFAVKMDKHYGLYDAPQGNDLVFVNLQENKDEGKFYRKSEVGAWDKIAKNLSQEFGGDNKVDYPKMKELILASIRGEEVCDNDNLREAVGAMSCDAKVSIIGFLGYLDDFEKSKEVDPKKLFSSKPEDNPVWAPSVEGGRSKPLGKRDEAKKNWEKGSLKREHLTKQEDLEEEVKMEDPYANIGGSKKVFSESNVDIKKESDFDEILDNEEDIVTDGSEIETDNEYEDGNESEIEVDYDYDLNNN